MNEMNKMEDDEEIDFGFSEGKSDESEIVE